MSTQLDRDAAAALLAWKVAQLRADALLDHALRLDAKRRDDHMVDPATINAVIASLAPPSSCTCAPTRRDAGGGWVTVAECECR